ncbi:MAG: thiamine phosphate synthase [Ardenticatenales bacterium]|jgi:thiamine-phosphate pyrophosphorylase|nr:thiamine phosphate synthase [Ardenticatenales bacterium]
MNAPDLRLYVILDPALTRGRPVAAVASAAIAGGATFLQVRAKGATTRQLIALVDAVQAVASPHGVPVIVNDRADVAFACGAAGVHLGPDDLPPAAARRLLGPGALVGCSAGTPDEAIGAARDGADYVGTGDVFGTTSKPDADAPIGLAGLAAVVAAATIPVVAIGGVTAMNARHALAAGAAGVAVLGAVGLADDPERAARAIRDAEASA